MGWITLGMKLLPYIVEAVTWVEKFITDDFAMIIPLLKETRQGFLDW